MEPSTKPLLQETEFVFSKKELQATREAKRSVTSIPSQLRVKISQLVDAEFGGYLWPSSHPLAWWIWSCAELVIGKRLLELGAGTALPGIVAAKLGAEVTFTDHPLYPAVLVNCKRSVHLNDLRSPVEPLEWGDLDATLLASLKPDTAPDIVIGADIFYNSKDFDDLFATINYLMELNPRVVVWTTYQNRSRHNVIAFLMRKWGIKSTVTELEDFYPEKLCAKLHADVILVTLSKGEPEI